MVFTKNLKVKTNPKFKGKTANTVNNALLNCNLLLDIVIKNITINPIGYDPII